MLLLAGTNVTATEAIKVQGFKDDDGVCLSSDERSALGQARCGTGSDGPCALIEIELDLSQAQLSEYRIDDWDDPPPVDFKVPVDLVNAQLPRFVVRRVERSD